MPKRLYNTKEAATRLNVSESTLNKWRVSGRGPRYRKFGAAVRYDEEDIDAFSNASARQSTSATEAA